MKFFSIEIYPSVLLASRVFLGVAANTCRYLPGDAGWPSPSAWNSLNTTVGGRLIATVPLGQPCHDPFYNATECKILQDEWTFPQLHLPSSSSVMAPFFANQSCDPFQPASRACLLGNYVDYAVNVSCPADIVAALKFAQDNNIRFVIRNTGHDYLGKSTGAGALSVWTHHLKDLEILDYSDDYYTGKAIKIGAGVEAYEIIRATAAAGLVSVGGECATVGVAGGYTQGGGHSALSTNFGLGADNTLSWEVVTAGGELVTASRAENSDLYWALSGGGGGTYGVVVSLTAKLHPGAIIGGAAAMFYSSNTTSDKFYTAIDRFHTFLPAIIDAGVMLVYFFTDSYFQILGTTAYGKTGNETQAILSDFTNTLDTLGINYTASFTTSATYEDHYNTYYGPLPYGDITVSVAQYGDRLIPRDTIQNNMEALSLVYRNLTKNGVMFGGVALNVSSPAITSNISNSVLPAWRNALIHVLVSVPWNFTAPWEDMVALQDEMTYSVVPQLEAVTPGSGAYMNEANFRQIGWKEDFFGENYDKLLSIKDKYDPDHLFYAVTAVGSDAWNVAADGRMCRA